jgi:phosphosulfolactate synthase
MTDRELSGRVHTSDYLAKIGVRDLPPLTSPFDPGYDPVTLAGHIEQSGHLMAGLKISMACWMIADEGSTRGKVAAARARGVEAHAGGGPFEVAVQQDRLVDYLELCADIGFARIECAEGFTDLKLSPTEIIGLATAHGLAAQFELGKKHGGAFTSDGVEALVDQGRQWLEAGAVAVVVEARESALGIGLFGPDGELDRRSADMFAEAFGLDTVLFEAPNKPSQFALIDHFGSSVRLCNVRLEEVLRVEIYRRGLHSDAFAKPHLRPAAPTMSAESDLR